MVTKGCKTAVRGPAGPRQRRAQPGVRHTALAAKNELEKRQEVSRGPSEMFSGQRDLVNPVAQEFARCTTAILTAVSCRIFLRGEFVFPLLAAEKDKKTVRSGDDAR